MKPKDAGLRIRVERSLDADEFLCLFPEAFGYKEATIRKLCAGASKKSEIGGVLHVNRIHRKAAEAAG